MFVFPLTSDEPRVKRHTRLLAGFSLRNYEQDIALDKSDMYMRNFSLAHAIMLPIYNQHQRSVQLASEQCVIFCYVVRHRMHSFEIAIFHITFVFTCVHINFCNNNNTVTCFYKNSSGDEIANVNFYAVRPEVTRIR